MWQWEEVLLELSHPLYNSHFALLLTLSPLQGIPGRCAAEQASPWLYWPQSLSSLEQPTSSCAWSNCIMASLTYLFFSPKGWQIKPRINNFYSPHGPGRNLHFVSSLQFHIAQGAWWKHQWKQRLFSAPQWQGQMLLCLGFGFCFSSPHVLHEICCKARPRLSSFYLEHNKWVIRPVEKFLKSTKKFFLPEHFILGGRPGLDAL